MKDLQASHRKADLKAIRVFTRASRESASLDKDEKVNDSLDQISMARYMTNIVFTAEATLASPKHDDARDEAGGRTTMKTIAISAAFAGLVLTCQPASATVEYGAGFHYIPGTDTCINDVTGDARQQTSGGTWRSLLPYPAGSWATNLEQECKSGTVVKIGKFTTSDFSVNAWTKMQTRAVPLTVKSSQFISKVFFSGGFYDPRLPRRSGTTNSLSDGLCLRSVDPTVQEIQIVDNVSSTFNPPFGNGMLPIGCVSNGRLVGMQAAYSINATAAYPNIDNYFAD
eukprot:gene21546-22438_t